MIHLILTDDWELRGDGTGNIQEIQFDTIRKLTKIYDDFGIKGTFMAEIMQQFFHLKLGKTNSKLHDIAKEWEEIVKSTYKRGHDFQIHIHPQWINAKYLDGKWELTSDWSIIKHSPQSIDALIKEGKEYLNSLLKPIDSDYNCIAFRGGSWVIAPDKNILSILAKNSIKLEFSLVNNLREINRVDIDYRNLEETFLPFYPRMDDARKLSSTVSPIISLPTFSFYERDRLDLSLLYKFRNVKFMGHKFQFFNKFLTPRSAPIVNAGYELEDYNRGLGKKKHFSISERIKSMFIKQLKISDLAHLNYYLFTKMINEIRTHADKTGLEVIPIVIENHTKNIGNFKPFERFAKYISKSSDLKVITAQELNKNIAKNMYKIVMKNNNEN